MSPLSLPRAPRLCAGAEAGGQTVPRVSDEQSRYRPRFDTGRRSASRRSEKNLTSFPPRAELFQFEILLYALYYELPEVCMSM